MAKSDYMVQDTVSGHLMAHAAKQMGINVDAQMTSYQMMDYKPEKEQSFDTIIYLEMPNIGGWIIEFWVRKTPPYKYKGVPWVVEYQARNDDLDHTLASEYDLYEWDTEHIKLQIESIYRGICNDIVELSLGPVNLNALLLRKP